MKGSCQLLQTRGVLTVYTNKFYWMNTSYNPNSKNLNYAFKVNETVFKFGQELNKTLENLTVLFKIYRNTCLVHRHLFYVVGHFLFICSALLSLFLAVMFQPLCLTRSQVRQEMLLSF